MTDFSRAGQAPARRRHRRAPYLATIALASALLVGTFWGIRELLWPTGAVAPTVSASGRARNGAEIDIAPGQALRMDFLYRRRPRTAPPPGWLAYDGTPYTPQRGYGWLEDVPDDAGGDGGIDAVVVLPSGARTSLRLLGRPELATWQGTHQENRPLVFRVDLPNGWYRVTCASVNPSGPLPVVDQRGIKCRANDGIFAGPRHGPPLAVSGMTLVEGADVVEVTGSHLRVVLGDPAYPGWTWAHPGPWYQGWQKWFGRPRLHRYAEHWSQKLTRTVDPGFHSLRLNALVIERLTEAPSPPDRVFRDVFDRDDDPDINRGVSDAVHWTRLGTGEPALTSALYKTSLRLTGPTRGRASIALAQPRPSPAQGLVRYATRVSIFTGEGSQAGSGVQEAGLLVLGAPDGTNAADATFVGVRVGETDAAGGAVVRVGRSELTIGTGHLPLRFRAGEYEIVVEHDVDRNVLARIAINDVNLTDRIAPAARHPPRSRGRFGIRAAMDPRGSGVMLQQFYWSFRVEQPTTPPRP